MNTKKLSEHITKLKLKVIDNYTDEIIDNFDYTILHWYSSEKTLISKLKPELNQNKKTLLQIISAEKYVRIYEMPVTAFKQNAETINETKY